MSVTVLRNTEALYAVQVYKALIACGRPLNAFEIRQKIKEGGAACASYTLDVVLTRMLERGLLTAIPGGLEGDRYAIPPMPDTSAMKAKIRESLKKSRHRWQTRSDILAKLPEAEPFLYRMAASGEVLTKKGYMDVKFKLYTGGRRT